MDQPTDLWRVRISRPDAPAVPVYVSGMRRTFWVPPRYRAIIVRTFSGGRWTLRDLAALTGYSLTGLGHALRRMQDWGMCRVTSTRGRLGATRIRWSLDVESRDVRRGNVPTTGRLDVSLKEREPVAAEGTYPDARPESWHRLGETLRALVR